MLIWMKKISFACQVSRLCPSKIGESGSRHVVCLFDRQRIRIGIDPYPYRVWFWDVGENGGRKLQIPVIHTYHTMYEDYLHYIANGKVLRPSHVKYLSRLFANHSTGVVCPSERVIDTLRGYGGITDADHPHRDRS